jgi:hypothetical protein
MTRDYHAEAREIARCLEDGGCSNDARSLIDAIETGSTGTEILMALRWNLQANLAMNLAVRARIRDLAGAISGVLGG